MAKGLALHLRRCFLGSLQERQPQLLSSPLGQDAAVPRAPTCQLCPYVGGALQNQQKPNSLCGAAQRRRGRGGRKPEVTTPPQPGLFITSKPKQRPVAQMQPPPPDSVEPLAPSGALWGADLAILECFTLMSGAQISLRFFRF